MHAGPVVAGVVGQERYQFDIWGDTVNVAARMVGMSAPGSVAVTQGRSGSRSRPPSTAKPLGELDVKGKGTIAVFGIRARMGEASRAPAQGNARGSSCCSSATSPSRRRHRDESFRRLKEHGLPEQKGAKLLGAWMALTQQETWCHRRVRRRGFSDEALPPLDRSQFAQDRAGHDLRRAEEDRGRGVLAASAL